jgi:hypothetical protein
MRGLRYVINGCILMTYESRKRSSKGRAAEPRAEIAPAIRGSAGGSRAFGRRLLYLSSASLSLPATSTKIERTCGCGRIEVGLHGEATTQFDSAGAVVRICQTTLDQRGGQPRVARVAATRARSWLRPSHFHHALFSWNIVLTVCCPTSWLRLFSSWCQINAGRSPSQYQTEIHKLRR